MNNIFNNVQIQISVQFKLVEKRVYMQKKS